MLLPHRFLPYYSSILRRFTSQVNLPLSRFFAGRSIHRRSGQFTM
uniref:Uncharacterized protein n=1 Tax=Medicago truncatula TaxID=3880 RepID=I3SNX2_MEDTR|nr:unknown [Medicago truncatula]